MTTTIRATCDVCGDVKLRNTDVTLRICSDTKLGAYRFQCPQCGKIMLKDVPEAVVKLLRDAHVRMEHWSLPIELFETKPEGLTISYDDIIDFHEFLKTDGEI